MGRNTVAISMAEPVQYLLIIVKVVSLKKSLLVRHKILSLFVKTLTVNDKHYLLNRDNLRQGIQMLLSEQQNRFSEFSFVFLKSILNFKHFPKKMTLIPDVLPEILAPKNIVK